MKKIINILIVLLLVSCLVSCGSKKQLPLPEVSEGVRGDLGIDKNINEETIDEYLNRDDAVYRDMRMLVDEADYGAIGGDSYLSGFVKGFEVVPYPYLCNVEGLPEAVGKPYTGETLFTHEDGKYVENYSESMEILESLFPKDKIIFLMCGGGGYAGMTKQLLVSLGWDANKIYNTGGFWYYKGQNKVDVKYEKDGENHYNFALVNYHDIKFDTLTKIHDSKTDKDIDERVKKSDFIQIKTADELRQLESQGKSLLLFVFLSGCPTCAEFLPIVEEYSKKTNIQIYSIDLNDIWGDENSVTERVKYAPSMMIYKDGEVIEYLESSNALDYDYYKSADKLSEWINENIDTNELEKCVKCTIQ